ncbi:MAG: hypothetical protein EXR53_00475 [Dehalococcoidia bacterium]|nr:hypothetical protein [Dehalococcoidia bacterium]
MNKRIGLFGLFGITVLLLAMVGAITAMAAPSGASVNGTVTLNKAWYSTADGGKSLTVTVTDADANVATAASESKVLAVSAGLRTQMVALTVAAGQRVSSPKILVAGQTCPSGTVDANLNVSVFGDGSAGNVIVQAGVGIAGGAQPVCYNKISIDTVLVAVKSGLDTTTYVTAATGIGSLVATETGVDTGIFTATVTLVEAASSSANKTLKTANADSITAEYTDTTPSSGTSLKITSVASKVETLKTSASSLVPANLYTTVATQVGFSGTVTDTGGSGVDIGTVQLFINTVAVAPTTVSGKSGDQSVTYSYTYATPLEAVHTWYVQAYDVAGNLGRSDSDAATAGDQDMTLTIDKTAPAIATVAAVTHAAVALVTSTTTGKFWDLSLSDPTEGKNKTTSLVLVFDADLDANSVQASDFTVTGNSVTAAAIYTFTNSPSTAILGRNRVYLTLGTAMSRDAKPTVAIASGQSVADLAGNVLGAGGATATVDAKDGIAPSFTFTLDKTLVKETLVVTITSTETVGSAFTVKAYPGADAAALGAGVKDFNTIEVTGTNIWKATFLTSTNAGKDGKYSVQISGKDQADNTGTGGKSDPTDPAASLFTQDTIINVSPADWAFTVGTIDFTAAVKDVQGTSPLVSVNFREAVTVSRAAFGVSAAEVDVLAAGTQSTDKKTWLYQATGLTVGKTYKVIISATDAAGNSVSDVGKTFNTIAVKLPETQLQPGQNLISFGGNPVNGDINVVFSDPSVIGVATYDGKTGTFQTAGRGLDGKLAGSLTKIDGQHAYFVKSSGFATLKVEIAKLGFDAAPSVIAVTKGWNLLSVVSVEGATPLAVGNTCATALAVGELAHCVVADPYLSTIKWTTAYTYNPIAGAWTKLAPKSFANLEIGRGYWVYVSEDGILVP